MLTIVGIDPGTTSAVAVLDLDGELVDYTSSKEFGKDDIIRFIVERGRPLLVATDVAPAPSLVAEVASNMGTVLVSPDEDLDSEYKGDLAGPFHVDADAHVHDALAAAEYARREHADTIDTVRRRAAEAGVDADVADVVELVVGGGLSISEAIGEVKKVAEPEEGEEGPEREPVDWESVAEDRQRRIDILESKVDNLEEHLAEVDDRDDGGVDETELQRRNRVINDLRRQVDDLEAELEAVTAERDNLRAAVGRLRDGWIAAPRVDRLGNATDPVVACDEPEGPAPPDVEVVLTSEPTDIGGVRTVDPADIETVEIDGAVIVPPDLAERQETDPDRFLDWLEEYRER